MTLRALKYSPTVCIFEGQCQKKMQQKGSEKGKSKGFESQLNHLLKPIENDQGCNPRSIYSSLLSSRNYFRVIMHIFWLYIPCKQSLVQSQYPQLQSMGKLCPYAEGIVPLQVVSHIIQPKPMNIYLIGRYVQSEDLKFKKCSAGETSKGDNQESLVI